MRAIDGGARIRSHFRLQAQGSSGAVSRSSPNVATPLYRQKSRRNNNAPHQQQLLASGVPHQSATHGYRRRGFPARTTRPPLVETEPMHRIADAATIAGDRAASAREALEIAPLGTWGLRGILATVRQASMISHYRQKSQGEIMAIARNRGWRREFRICQRHECRAQGARLSRRRYA